MKLKEIIGKKIYSIYEGEVVGTIMRANFDKDYTKINSFCVFNDEEEEFILHSHYIKSMSDCVIISNKHKLKPLEIETFANILNVPVFDDNAKSLGNVVDIEFDNSGKIKNFITSSNILLEPKNVYLRKSFIFYSDKKIKISNLCPRKNEINPSKIRVNILKEKEENEVIGFLPSKLQYNPQNILGKISKGDLVGLNNEVIIKTNQIITEKTIKDATRHNRLNQLYYLAK